MTFVQLRSGAVVKWEIELLWSSRDCSLENAFTAVRYLPQGIRNRCSHNLSHLKLLYWKRDLFFPPFQTSLKTPEVFEPWASPKLPALPGPSRAAGRAGPAAMPDALGRDPAAGTNPPAFLLLRYPGLCHPRDGRHEHTQPCSPSVAASAPVAEPEMFKCACL